MLLSEVEELAAKYGMESCGYNFLDGYLEGVEFQDKKTKKTTMFLEAEFTPEYEEELQELEDGTEYQIDASKCVVTNACVYGPFVNESGFLDGSQNGILLFGKESLEGVNDGMYHHNNLTYEFLQGFLSLGIRGESLFKDLLLLQNYCIIDFE